MPAPTATTPAPPRGLRGYGARTFSSLSIPDFRVLWLGNVGTMLGTWIQFAAQGYLVLQLTGSPFQVGAVSFARGIYVDRLLAVRRPHHGSLQPAQCAHGGDDAVAAIVAVMLAVLIITDVISVWMMYPIALAEGITDAIDQPARQVMVYDVVGEEELANAVAVNSLGSNTMRDRRTVLAGALIGFVWHRGGVHASRRSPISCRCSSRRA